MHRLTREAKIGYLFLLPSIAVFLCFVLYPFIYTIVLSFFDYNWFTKKTLFNGIGNYISLFADQTFWAALGRTIFYTIGTLAGQCILAFGIALLLNKEYAGIGIIRSIFLLPWILPTVVTALAWRMMLHERWGVITYLLELLNITDGRVAFLADTALALPSVMAVSIWRGFPLLMVSFIAALQSVPKELYEAAIIDGASWFNQLFHITLPYLRKLIAIIVLFRTIWVFNDYDLVWLMTRGGPAFATETLPIYVYQRSFGAYKFGEAASIAMVIFFFLVVMSGFYFKLIEKED